MFINGREYTIAPGADLSWANLSWADLSGADLSEANLSGANLSWANLSGVNLSGVNLSVANLSVANLSGANLSEADLSWADLSGADLRNASLPPFPAILLAQWGDVSDSLCIELMRYDCANLPNGRRLFAEWKRTGRCPYSHARVQCAALFRESRESWEWGKPKTAMELAIALIREKCRDSDYHVK